MVTIISTAAKVGHFKVEVKLGAFVSFKRCLSRNRIQSSKEAESSLQIPASLQKNIFTEISNRIVLRSTVSKLQTSVNMRLHDFVYLYF